VDWREPSDPKVVDDTLACLAHARPSDGPQTPRHLDEATYRGAFDAWAVAQAQLVEAWNHASDPANLIPRIPKALSDAAEIVRENRPTDLTLEESDKLVEQLLAPYPERIVRQVRNVIVGDTDPADKVRELADFAREEGLRPPPPPEPLPEITADDVHAVAWIAITPAQLDGRSHG
jgi:hypothetical protein